MKVFKEKKNKAESKPSCIRRKQIFDVYEKRLECKKKIAENETKKLRMIMKFLCSQKFDVDHVLLGFYLREHYYYYYYYLLLNKKNFSPYNIKMQNLSLNGLKQNAKM